MAEARKVSDSLFSRDKVVNRRKNCDLHFHDEHELYYMLEGRTTYFIGDGTFNVEKGDFVFVAKGGLHGTDSGECKKTSRILLNFPDSVFSGEGQQLYLELCKYPLICVSGDKSVELEEQLLKIEREYKNRGKYWELLIYSYILELLAQLCRHRCNRKKVIRDSDQIIYEIAAYIGENYSQDISLQKLSRQFAISESYLSRKFKAVMGIGINRYITIVRVSNAERLLHRGKVSVVEVARNCGYNDSNYFSVVFQKIKGVTPFQIIRGKHEELE